MLALVQHNPATFFTSEMITLFRENLPLYLEHTMRQSDKDYAPYELIGLESFVTSVEKLDADIKYNKSPAELENTFVEIFDGLHSSLEKQLSDRKTQNWDNMDVTEHAVCLGSLLASQLGINSLKPARFADKNAEKLFNETLAFFDRRIAQAKAYQDNPAKHKADITVQIARFKLYSRKLQAAQAIIDSRLPQEAQNEQKEHNEAAPAPLVLPINPHVSQTNIHREIQESKEAKEQSDDNDNNKVDQQAANAPGAPTPACCVIM